LTSEGQRSKVKVAANENLKTGFCAYLREKWINLRQTKTKMSHGPSYTCRIHFTSINAPFSRYLSVCLSVCLSHISLIFHSRNIGTP